jgi:hypothetical protein
VSFGEQLLATLVGGGIAVVTGVIAQLLASRHERDQATRTWDHQRADLRADAQRAAVVELQAAVRRYRISVINLGDADIQAMKPNGASVETETLREMWNAMDALGEAISHVTDRELREAAQQAREQLGGAFGLENRRQLASVLRSVEPALARIDELVTRQLDTL